MTRDTPSPPPRALGATGLRVSPIGLGLAALGRPGYINLGHADDLGGDRSVAALEARAFEVLDAAWDAGVRAFDAARSYGRGEVFLGRWLEQRAIAPAEVAISSKWGYTYTADWQVEAETHEVKEHSLSVLRRQWVETREHLGAHLDLYQVHSVTPESPALGDPRLLRALASLKTRGVHVGLSTSGPEQATTIARALALEVDGVRLYESVQVTWNLLERGAGAALAEARSAGMGVIVKEALANGRLTSRNDDPAFAEQRALLALQAERLGTSVDALALAGVLAQPWADMVLSGASTAEQLRSNLQALDVAWDEEAASRLAPLAETPEDYWQRRSALPWN